MQPIYLFYLISSTDTLISISEHIFRLYAWESEINLAFLRRKMIDAAGDREVVSRSVRAFMATLEFFGLVARHDKKWRLKQTLPLNEEQAAIMLQLWARELRHTPQIDLNQLPPAGF